VNVQPYLFQRPLPHGLEALADLALDLRWTWSHFSDSLWQYLDANAWEWTGNPYFILQSVSQARLEAAAGDVQFRAKLRDWMNQRQRYLDDPGWFAQQTAASVLKGIAYFSMEFGLGEALPIYSGGLGILAGDYLKVASDLGVPIIGIGLLYQQGYFRQSLGSEGWQVETFPYNDPVSLPVTPVRSRENAWLQIPLELPGRRVMVRVWQARVGKVSLYLLDTNDPLNTPRDRGITAHLYPAGDKPRLLQEIILGVGGWQVLEALQHEIDICHLNEGHAAFAILARARSFAQRTQQSFAVALWATRAGNIFTTHTSVEAAFDRFEPALIKPYAHYLSELVAVPVEQLLALGRRDPGNQNEPFNMAYLAMRGSGAVNGVSRLHGAVSRGIFQALYLDWPQVEVPVGSVTNGVHVPSWDSQEADTLWTSACGKGRWVGELKAICALIEQISDQDLWAFRAAQRQSLVGYIRRRLARQVQEHGATPEKIHRAAQVLDPHALLLGFARRFTEYKRPTLLLHDPDRLAQLLGRPERQVQLVVAGKAHPDDDEGKRLVQAMARFAERSELCDRAVFLEDYDIDLAQHLVAGIDVWVNTPRRPWEACGTSGMKVLVNGGLNLSELDGWWSEAYAPEVGWALGDGREHHEGEWDAVEADQLYDVLERQVIPEFYDRDRGGIPVRWLKRIRASMSRLTTEFSCNRMLLEYLEKVYVSSATAYRRRTAEGGKLAVELAEWQGAVSQHWQSARFGQMRVTQAGGLWQFEVELYGGNLTPDLIRIELYADALKDEGPTRITMSRAGSIPGAGNAYLYIGHVPATRPAWHYTPRMVPFHPDAVIPLESTSILWKR
jgi:starch phosphorylase